LQISGFAAESGGEIGHTGRMRVPSAAAGRRTSAHLERGRRVARRAVFNPRVHRA
jgi:hypothetical protein